MASINPTAALGAVLLAVSLGGCSDLPSRADTGAVSVPQLEDRSGRCYGLLQTPAAIETRTEQVMVQPAILNADGSLRSAAVYRTVTHQVITRERRETRFEALCAEDQTPEKIAAIQRALQARGHYSGPITGTVTPATARAIRSYQVASGGPDMAIISLDMLRRLGLEPYPEHVLRAE